MALVVQVCDHAMLQNCDRRRVHALAKIDADDEFLDDALADSGGDLGGA
jgi:hypothetical protein